MAYDGSRRGTDGPDFDFDKDSADGNSFRQSDRGASAMAGGHNPHFGHSTAQKNDPLALEREEIDLRGKLLQENIVKREGDPQNELRLGGNYLHVEDPNKPPYSPFYMMVTGHIQSGTFDG